MLTQGILEMLPTAVMKKLYEYKNIDKLQEIRMRGNKPIILQLGEKEIITDLICTNEDIKTTLQKISRYSLYAYEDEMKQGFITIKGGHRIGICGSYITEGGRIKTLKDPGSLNIRISSEIKGCSDHIVGYIKDEKNIYNTLLISPPGCGKTTLLRDLCRNISNGFGEISGQRVCVIDERSEIAACYFGIPQMDLGIRCDVLDNCRKAEGIIMAIRTMAPDVIMCDEIGSYDDVESILTALNCGVNIIASIHGYTLEDYTKRAVFNDLIINKVFKRAVLLSKRKGAGTIENIFDIEAGRDILDGF